jgi:hypothetical protein
MDGEQGKILIGKVPAYSLFSLSFYYELFRMSKKRYGRYLARGLLRLHGAPSALTH